MRNWCEWNPSYIPSSWIILVIYICGQITNTYNYCSFMSQDRNQQYCWQLGDSLFLGYITFCMLFLQLDMISCRFLARLLSVLVDFDCDRRRTHYGISACIIQGSIGFLYLNISSIQCKALHQILELKMYSSCSH